MEILKIDDNDTKVEKFSFNIYNDRYTVESWVIFTAKRNTHPVEIRISINSITCPISEDSAIELWQLVNDDFVKEALREYLANCAMDHLLAVEKLKEEQRRFL